MVVEYQFQANMTAFLNWNKFLIDWASTDAVCAGPHLKILTEVTNHANFRGKIWSTKQLIDFDINKILGEMQNSLIFYGEFLIRFDFVGRNIVKHLRVLCNLRVLV